MAVKLSFIGKRAALAALDQDLSNAYRQPLLLLIPAPPCPLPEEYDKVAETACDIVEGKTSCSQVAFLKEKLGALPEDKQAEEALALFKKYFFDIANRMAAIQLCRSHNSYMTLREYMQQFSPLTVEGKKEAPVFRWDADEESAQVMQCQTWAYPNVVVAMAQLLSQRYPEISFLIEDTSYSSTSVTVVNQQGTSEFSEYKEALSTLDS